MDARMGVVGVKAVVKPLLQRRRRYVHLEVKRLGPLIEALQVPIEKGYDAFPVRTRMNAQALPDAVAEDETGIEYRDLRFESRIQLSVDIDLYALVARVGDECVCRLSHCEARMGCAAVIR